MSNILKFILILPIISCLTMTICYSFSYVGARGWGMGGACIASLDDVSAIYWNPAGLSNIINSQFIIEGFLTSGKVPVYSNELVPFTSRMLSNIAKSFKIKGINSAISFSWIDANDFIFQSMKTKDLKQLRDTKKLCLSFANGVYKNISLGTNIDGLRYKVINNKYCYEEELDIKDKASGVYIYVVKTQKESYSPLKVVKKLAIIR